MYMHRGYHWKETYSVGDAWWCWDGFLLWRLTCRLYNRTQKLSNRPGWKDKDEKIAEETEVWEFENLKDKSEMRVNPASAY